jgi:hypothetical protein
VKLPKEAQMDRMRIKKGKSKRSSGDMTDNPAVVGLYKLHPTDP